jgi:uncharacterized membrane protein
LERLGEGGYKGLFSLIALIGIILIAIGMGNRDIITLWEPPIYLSHLAIVVMIPVFILMAAAYMPCNMKKYTRHPMLWGVTLWAFAHLLANGDFGSIVLFASFLIYSLYDMWSANRRGAEKSTNTRPLFYDTGVAALGIVAYVFFFLLHPYIIGVPVIRW